MTTKPLLTALFAVLASSAVAAQDGKLGYADLSRCATYRLAIDRGTAGTADRLAELAAARATVAREAAVLARDRGLIDRHDAVAVARFNARATRACADYAAYVADMNAIVALANAAALPFNSGCAGRDYSPAMVARLPDALAAAWRRATGGEQVAMLSNAMPQSQAN